MSAPVEANKIAHAAADGAPIVVDIGKKSKKQIKQLRKGRGKLLGEIDDLIEELRTAGSISASAQPVIIVVKEKRKASPLLWPIGWVLTLIRRIAFVTAPSRGNDGGWRASVVGRLPRFRGVDAGAGSWRLQQEAEGLVQS